MKHLLMAFPVPSIDENEIAALEKRLNVSFPDTYKEFLAIHNGGGPSAENQSFVCEDGDFFSVQFFLSVVNSEDPYYEIDNIVERYGARIPHELFPIAKEAFGDLVLIGVDGTRRGQVFLWDHEKEALGHGYANISLIAPHFEKLSRGIA